jgi:hypothetical protein
MWWVQVSFLWKIDMWKTRADDARSRVDGNQDGQAAYAPGQASQCSHTVGMYGSKLNFYIVNGIPCCREIKIYVFFFLEALWKLRKNFTKLPK